LCRDAQAKIRALGTKDKSAADSWNTLMGFGYALTNPDGGAAVPGAVKDDLKKRDAPKVSKRQASTITNFIECSTEVWIDNCNGWTGSSTKREAPAVIEREEPKVAKRENNAPTGPAKRGNTNGVYCSTDEWIDNCTGWP
jgi:hypothetical protein